MEQELIGKDAEMLGLCLLLFTTYHLNNNVITEFKFNNIDSVRPIFIRSVFKKKRNR